MGRDASPILSSQNSLWSFDSRVNRQIIRITKKINLGIFFFKKQKFCLPRIEEMFGISDENLISDIKGEDS